MSKDSNKVLDEYDNIHYLGKEIARGGQGAVYRTGDDNLAIKLSNSDSAEFEKIFKEIRKLPLPKNIHISLPIAILKDGRGYVMKLLRVMSPLSDVFSTSGTADTDMPAWLKEWEKADKEFAHKLLKYSLSGSAYRRLYALYKCAVVLARLHNRGIVYGDISPNNVFIGNGVPCDCWLIDADNLRPESSEGKGVWTPGYGAPEVIQNTDVNRSRTDCWSFAIMAFKMLCLCEPFKGKLFFDELNNDDGEDNWDNDNAFDSGGSDNPHDKADAGLYPFIDDENDRQNEYKGGLPRDLALTDNLKKLFQATLGHGRTQPHRRSSMMIWALELARAFDDSVVCPNCSMSYYYGAEYKECPYCESPLPSLIVIKTDRWRKVLTFEEGNDITEAAIPHRLFYPFSLTEGDRYYQIVIDTKEATVTQKRGEEEFPFDFNFEIITHNDTKYGTAKKGNYYRRIYLDQEPIARPVISSDDKDAESDASERGKDSSQNPRVNFMFCSQEAQPKEAQSGGKAIEAVAAEKDKEAAPAINESAEIYSQEAQPREVQNSSKAIIDEKAKEPVQAPNDYAEIHSQEAQPREAQSGGEAIEAVAAEKTIPPYETEEEITYILEALVGSFSYEVKAGSVLIGREHEMKDYLSDKNYVSREHARLTMDSSGLFIEHIGKTNPTFVNNKAVKRKRLQIGDVIGLAGIIESDGKYQKGAAYFKVCKKQRF